MPMLMLMLMLRRTTCWCQGWYPKQTAGLTLRPKTLASDQWQSYYSSQMETMAKFAVKMNTWGEAGKEAGEEKGGRRHPHLQDICQFLNIWFPWYLTSLISWYPWYLSASIFVLFDILVSSTKGTPFFCSGLWLSAWRWWWIHSLWEMPIAKDFFYFFCRFILSPFMFF